MALMYISNQLTKDRDLIKQLAKELSPYKSVDLNLRELEKLPLFNAVHFECLRMFPPVPIPTARICPPQGVTIEGCFISLSPVVYL
jgi:cytochrome P450